MITFVGMGFLNARSIYVTRSVASGLKYPSLCAPRIQYAQSGPVLFFFFFFSIWTRCALDDVSSIGCFRIGTSDKPEDNPLTIFVTVNSNTGHNWKGMRDEIVRILDSHDLSMVAVKIQADKILRRNRGNALSGPDGFVADSVIPGPARVGQSLGRQGVQDGSGTFGGFLELRYPSSQDWVTYWHYLFPVCSPRGQSGRKFGCTW